MKKKNSIAILVIIAVLLSSLPVMAEPEEVIIPAEVELSESEGREEAAEELTVQESLKVQAEELESLEAGEDYIENEAVFSANSKEEAEEVAESYGAELSSWSDGIAVIEFDREIKESLTEAAKSVSVDRVIVPNYLFETADYGYAGELAENEALEDNVSETESTTPSDPYYVKQWHHTKINSKAAWEVTSGNSVSVAIIDNGFDAYHEDLSGRVKETYNVSDGSSDVSPVSSSTVSHGSHVAGIVAATVNNGKGGCGVAPEADLYLIRVANADGKMPVANLLRAINVAAEWKVDVVNMSIGSASLSLEGIRLLQEAIDGLNESGATLVCASGNKGTDTEFYPAACDGVLSVAAIDSSGTLASYSNYGEWVDLAAPGTTIYSCYMDNKYGNMSGTSMASPVVAGVAALVYAINPDISALDNEDASEAVRAKILETTDGVTYSSSSTGGSVTGCVDAAKAVGSAAQVPAEKESAFYVKTSSGFITDGGTLWISKGKKISFTIVDANGNKIKAASKKSAVTYSSSDTSNFKLKNNKLSCLKKANAYSADVSYTSAARTTVTVTYNNSTVKLKFIALDKIRKAAVSEDRKTKSLKISVSQGKAISLNKISYICGKEIYFYGENNAEIGTSYTLGYLLSIPKKAKSMVTYDSDGNPATFTPTKKGTYTFKVTAPGGIKKKFSIKIKVA